MSGPKTKFVKAARTRKTMEEVICGTDRFEFGVKATTFNVLLYSFSDLRYIRP